MLPPAGRFINSFSMLRTGTDAAQGGVVWRRGPKPGNGMWGNGRSAGDGRPQQPLEAVPGFDAGGGVQAGTATGKPAIVPPPPH